jgi:hypothetical protein
VSQAVAVIIGAILGGLLTSVPAIVAELLRSKEARNAHRQSEQRELQVACRMVLEELAEQDYLLITATESGLWWPDAFDLPTSTWDRYGHILATHMDDENEWITVALAYTIAKAVNTERQSMRDRHMGTALDADAFRTLGAAGANADARDVIRRQLGLPELVREAIPEGWSPGQLSLEWEIEYRHRVGR